MKSGDKEMVDLGDVGYKYPMIGAGIKCEILRG